MAGFVVTVVVKVVVADDDTEVVAVLDRLVVSVELTVVV